MDVGIGHDLARQVRIAGRSVITRDPDETGIWQHPFDRRRTIHKHPTGRELR
jgi:hypothetical protein